MKTRVLVISTLCLALMLMASLAVLAESSIQSLDAIGAPNESGTYSFAATILDNSTPVSGKQVTMLVYNLGQDPENNPDAPASGNIIGIDQAVSIEDGTVGFTFGTNESTSSGTYSVLVGGEDVNTAASTTFTIGDATNPVDAINAATDATTMEAALNDAAIDWTNVENFLYSADSATKRASASQYVLNYRDTSANVTNAQYDSLTQVQDLINSLREVIAGDAMLADNLSESSISNLNLYMNGYLPIPDDLLTDILAVIDVNNDQNVSESDISDLNLVMNGYLDPRFVVIRNIAWPQE